MRMALTSLWTMTNIRVDDPNFKPGWLTVEKIRTAVKALSDERKSKQKLIDRVAAKHYCNECPVKKHW